MIGSASTDVGDIQELQTIQELDALKKEVGNIRNTKGTNPRGIVILCSASWYEPCNVLKDNVLPELSKLYKKLVFAWIDCDKFVDLVDKYAVETAPTVLILHPHSDEFSKYVNPSPDVLNDELKKADDLYQSLANISAEIEAILASGPMVAFIKGTPSEPKCKFTRKLLGHFNELELTFKHFNILEDEKVRSWLKLYSNWPTYPQVYINQELIGGVDIVVELIESGEFMDMVPKECKKPSATEMFDQMLSSFDVVVLIEGTPDKPSTEESKSMINTLNTNSIKYVTVDYSALSEDVKKHISTTYSVTELPYIFLKKTPFGNEETFLKVVQDNALENTIPEGSRKLSLNDRLKKLISKSHCYFHLQLLVKLWKSDELLNSSVNLKIANIL